MVFVNSTDSAGYGQVLPLVHPSHPDLHMMWHAPVGPVTAPLVPVFLGQTEVPDEFAQHRYLTTGEAHRFLDRRKEATDPDTVSHVPQGVEVSDSAVYQYKRLMHLAFQDEGLLKDVSQIFAKDNRNSTTISIMVIPSTR